VAERSRYRYKGIFLRYQEYLRGKPPSVEASIGIMVYLKKSGGAPSTLKVAKSAVSLFHQWRGETLDFKVKVPKRKPPYIESAQVESLLERASKNPRHRVALALMAFGGLRISEVANLKFFDVSFSNNSLRFVDKGGKSNIIPIPGRVRGMLAELPPGNPRDGLVGLTASGIYKVVKRLAPDMHPPRSQTRFCHQAGGEGRRYQGSSRIGRT